MSGIFLKTKDGAISYDEVIEIGPRQRVKSYTWDAGYQHEVTTRDGKKHLIDELSLKWAEWRAGETFADTSGRQKLVHAYVTDSELTDENVSEFVIKVHDIIGWKHFRHQMLPVVASPSFLDHPWEVVHGALFQTVTGEVCEMKGRRKNHKSIEAFEQAISDKLNCQQRSASENSDSIPVT